MTTTIVQSEINSDTIKNAAETLICQITETAKVANELAEIDVQQDLKIDQKPKIVGNVFGKLCTKIGENSTNKVESPSKNIQTLSKNTENISDQESSTLPSLSSDVSLSKYADTPNLLQMATVCKSKLSYE